MNIIQLASLAILCSFVIMIVKSVNKEMAVLLSILCGVILLGIAANFVYSIFKDAESIFSKTNTSVPLLSSMIKIIGIGYITEFAANISEDCSNSSLAEKVRLVGKLAIFASVLPLLKSFLNLVLNLLG